MSKYHLSYFSVFFKHDKLVFSYFSNVCLCVCTDDKSYSGAYAEVSITKKQKKKKIVNL